MKIQNIVFNNIDAYWVKAFISNNKIDRKYFVKNVKRM